MFQLMKYNLEKKIKEQVWAFLYMLYNLPSTPLSSTNNRIHQYFIDSA